MSDFDRCFEAVFCGNRQVVILHKYHIGGNVYHICTVDSNDHYSEGWYLLDPETWEFRRCDRDGNVRPLISRDNDKRREGGRTMPYTFDRTGINPTQEDLRELQREAAEVANQNARSRTINAPLGSIQEILSATEGAYWVDGGGVPNSYGHRARTSAIGVAWWTDAKGNKLIRIVGGRVDAPQSSFARRGTKAFGLSDAAYDAIHCAALVYPCPRVLPPLKTDKGLIPEILRSLVVEPTDRAARALLADLLIDGPEQRHLVTVEQCRAAPGGTNMKIRIGDDLYIVDTFDSVGQAIIADRLTDAGMTTEALILRRGMKDPKYTFARHIGNVMGTAYRIALDYREKSGWNVTMEFYGETPPTYRRTAHENNAYTNDFAVVLLCMQLIDRCISPREFFLTLRDLLPEQTTWRVDRRVKRRNFRTLLQWMGDRCEDSIE